METKANEGIDDGILFDIEAKRTNLFEEEKISKRNEKLNFEKRLFKGTVRSD
jgi:hypothetical protein